MNVASSPTEAAAGGVAWAAREPSASRQDAAGRRQAVPTQRCGCAPQQPVRCPRRPARRFDTEPGPRRDRRPVRRIGPATNGPPEPAASVGMSATTAPGVAPPPGSGLDGGTPAHPGGADAGYQGSVRKETARLAGRRPGGRRSRPRARHKPAPAGPAGRQRERRSNGRLAVSCFRRKERPLAGSKESRGPLDSPRTDVARLTGQPNPSRERNSRSRSERCPRNRSRGPH